MRSWTGQARGLFFLFLAPLAGCDGGTSSNRLPVAEVAGSYQVCALTFTPSSRFLPAVDLRDRAFELSAQGVTPPRLKLDSTGSFELEYTPRGQFTDVEHRGTFETRQRGVILSFAQATEVAPLLLPSRVAADWSESTRTLTPSDPYPYAVTKASYEAMLGESDPGIPARVDGTLSGRFSLGACD
jgi:hypothetical protein